MIKSRQRSQSNKVKFITGYLIVAGVLTTVGGAMFMFSPSNSVQNNFGFNLNNAELLLPLAGHWGIMVMCVGLLLLLSAKNRSLRIVAISFALIEKIYLVTFCLYLYCNSPIIYSSYLTMIVTDGAQVLGGLISLGLIYKANNSETFR